MGICSSCLGLDRRESHTDSESQHLLSDPYQNQYGGAGADARQPYQIDAEEIRRQRDALERLCAQTSDKLIDVAIPTLSSASKSDSPSATPSNFPSTSKVTADYPSLFAERFGPFIESAAAQVPRISPPDTGDMSSIPQSSEEQIAWLGRILGTDMKDAAAWKTEGLQGHLSIAFEDALLA